MTDTALIMPEFGSKKPKQDIENIHTTSQSTKEEENKTIKDAQPIASHTAHPFSIKLP